MKQTLPNLQICVYKVNGATTVFIQHDAGEIRKILDSFQPDEIFGRDRFVITDGESVTSLPVAGITRIDLDVEQSEHLVLPADIVEAVELNETEYGALVRNPTIRDQWQQADAGGDSMVTFLDLEMADGQRLLLTAELRVDSESESLSNTGWPPLEKSSLCFRMRSGGVGVLNLANLVRLTYFPRPGHSRPGAWQARQFSPITPICADGNLSSTPIVSRQNQ